MIDGFLSINASPSSTSKTAALANLAVELNGAGLVVHLGMLDAEALLARRAANDVTEVLAAIASAPVIFIASPIYRASYSGLLKVLFDQLPQNALLDKACVLAATGGSLHHFLAVDMCMRPLMASLNGVCSPTSIYATSADFSTDLAPNDDLRERLRSALAGADSMARSLNAAV